MARHGSAVAEHPGPVSPDTIPGPPRRGRGAASWPIRRKLTALVALPTAIGVGLITYLGVNSAQALAQTTRATRAADGVAAANALTTAGDAEMQATFAAAVGTPDAAQQITARRQATDAAYAALQKQITGGLASAGGAVQERAGTVSQVAQTLAGVRALVDQPKRTYTVDNKPVTSSITPETFAQGYDVAFQPVRDLAAALSADLGTATPDPRTVESAGVLGNVTAAASRGSQEMAALTPVLFSNAKDLPRASSVQEAITAQRVLLLQARGAATPDQVRRIDEVIGLEAKLDPYRTIGLDAARTGTGERSNAASAGAQQYAKVAGERLGVLNELVAVSAQELQRQTSTDRRAALVRMIFLTALGLGSVLLIGLLLSALARTITGPMAHGAAL